MRSNLVKIAFLCVVALGLAACSTPKLKATMDKDDMISGRYIASENYADHRLQQKQFLTSGGRMSALSVGQGPVLVMLHGVPTSSWLYRKMISDLQNDFHVIAIDLLGYGSSDKPESDGANYLPASQANYVEEVLNQLGVTKYNLVFHDMGGLIAWELVSRDIARDNAIESLTVLNTIISKQGFDYPKTKKGVMAKAMSEAYASELSSAAVLELTFKNMGLSSSAKLSEKECFGYVAPMREGADAALYDFFTGFDDARFGRLESLIAALSAYRGRVQVLWGGLDKVLTTAQLPQLKAPLQLSDENITIFPNNSHFLPEEIPEQLNAKLREFLLTN